MATKKITEKPRTTDTILFELETPDANGCFAANPYKVDQVVIYYVERDFLAENYGEYQQWTEDSALVTAVQKAQAAYCSDPSDQNLYDLELAQNALESSRLSTTYYYKDRTAVKVIGVEGYPAWLSTDTTNSPLVNVEEDDDGNLQYGHFTYEWDTQGSVREGDYFICWTWTPNPAGSSLSAHLPFRLEGDPRAVITIPTHLCDEDKYETLLERYLPEMYKTVLSETDLTPSTTLSFNQAVASGFTFLENLANQIIDLFDANALHESMLVYLSNLFDLRLKSSDPTLWRRQIKEAVSLFKKKGTYPGLQQAFAQAGMSLNSYTQFWQIISPYTWQESFKVSDSTVFELTKEAIVEPIDSNNFGLWVRYSGSSVYTAMPPECVSFAVGEDYVLKMTWVGDQLSTPVELEEDDIVRVLYEYKEVPNSTEQQLENYIRSLPLADQRDETDQIYPLKNWNVRLIAEDDVMFDTLVPVRHPYHDPLIFGYIRTEFPYGENIYNMEEYNGSTRPSLDVCHIGQDFLDPCGACISSKYSVDVAIEELNNDRIEEAMDILDEYMPFHAQLHSLNFSGSVNEFVQSPVEEVDFLVTIDRLENVLSGQANPLFHRTMEGGLSNWLIDREDLADRQTVLSGQLGTAYNDLVVLVAVNHRLQDLGVMDFSNVLEILSPSPNAGTYVLVNAEGNTAEVHSAVIEPVNQSAFTFNLYNIPFSSLSTSISQIDLFTFSDSSVDFAQLGVKTQWDSTNTPDYSGGAWKVLLPAYSATPYEIQDIRNGELILDGDSSLPTTNVTGLSYTLLTDTDTTAASETTGELQCERRAYVDMNATFVDVDSFIRLGDYVNYGGSNYEIVGIDGDNLWISGWTSGDVAGVSVAIHRVLLENAIGYFGYRGLSMTTFADHEAEFSIVNGSNPPAIVTDDSHFKENYMFKIGEQYFQIAEWNGNKVKLVGREQNWTTQSAGGTVTAYSLIHFPKKQVNVQFTVFSHLDRDGHDVVIREIEDKVDQNVAIVALASGDSNGVQENVSQEEGITFHIERTNGDNEEGEI